MDISLEKRQQVENVIRNHPDLTNSDIGDRTKIRINGKRKRLPAEVVQEIRMKMNKTVNENGSPEPAENENKPNLNDMALTEDDACYEADTVQKIMDWLKEHAEDPETGKAQFWPQYLVRQEIGVNSDEFRAAINSETLSPHKEKLKGEWYLCYSQDAVLNVRQRKIRR